MTSQRFAIHNRAELQRSSASIPLVHHLSRVLSWSRVVNQISEVPLDRSPRTGWMVFRASDDSGFAIQHGDLIRGRSAIQRTLEWVRGAEAVVKSFGGVGAFPLELSLEEYPPHDWKFMRIDALVGEVWFATSALPTPVKVRMEGAGCDWRVRCKVESLVPLSDTVGPESVLRCEGAQVIFPEVGVYGRIMCSKEGEVSVEVEAVNQTYEQQVPGVRLDLGEIEVRLSDLVSLRPGAVVNLGEVSLERCYLRLGATILAEGRFSSKEGELLLRIDSVL